jgi:uncharacterized membrane protein YdcZ (DUF606 family)
MTPKAIAIAFLMGSFVLLGVSSSVLLRGSRSFQLKKRAYPFLLAGMGTLFALFVLSLEGSLPSNLAAVSAIALVVLGFIGMRGICPGCGRTGFRKTNCRRCGGTIQ